MRVDFAALAPLAFHDPLTSCDAGLTPSFFLSTLAITGPASILLTVYSTLTPKTSSPASRERWTGDAPRQRGRREGWMLTVPRRGMARKRLGR